MKKYYQLIPYFLLVLTLTISCQTAQEDVVLLEIVGDNNPKEEVKPNKKILSEVKPEIAVEIDSGDVQDTREPKELPELSKTEKIPFKVLTIGDSLTTPDYSFARIVIKNQQFKDSKIIALGSMNTTWMKEQLITELARIEKNKDEKPYNFVLILGGTNESERRKEDLQFMYNLVNQYGAKNIRATLPGGEFASSFSEKRRERDRELNNWIKETKGSDLVVDFFSKNRKDFDSDGVHLTQEGQKKMAKKLITTIK